MKNKIIIIACLFAMAMPAQAGTKRYVPSVEDWVATYASASQKVEIAGLRIKVLPSFKSVLVLGAYDPAKFTQADVEAIAQEVADFTQDYITSRKINNLPVTIDVGPFTN